MTLRHQGGRIMGRQVAQSVERRTLEVEVRGSKLALGAWWWGRISSNQPYPKGAAPAGERLQISLNGINGNSERQKKKKKNSPK